MAWEMNRMAAQRQLKERRDRYRSLKETTKLLLCIVAEEESTEHEMRGKCR
jgi:hypothetical protein